MDNGASSYRRFLDGDDNGLVEIIEKYKDGLIIFLNRYVSNLYIAEDLAEDTFLKLIIKKPNFIENTSFKAWLYTIGRNLALNYIKKNSRVVLKSNNDVERSYQELKHLEEQYFSEERKIIIHNALKNINKDYSTVLYLVYFENFTITHTAHIMKKTKRQIGNLLYRAKQSLKAELVKEGISIEEWL